MGEWPTTSLGQLCKGNGGAIQTGPFGSQLHRSDYLPSGVPVVMPTNIQDGRIVLDGIAYISEADAERLGRHRLKLGDIVFSRRGEVDKCAVTTDREVGWLCGTGCLLARLNAASADAAFLGYHINFEATRLWLRQHAVGLVMPNLNTSILEAIPLSNPPLAEQRAIAAVLSSLDDKIELNRRMNETLEAATRALFRDWFVEFGPTRAKAEGRPAYLAPDLWSLFPDRLGDDGVPEGWATGTLGEIAKAINAKVEPENIDPDTPYIGLEHMPRRSIALTEWEGAGKVTSGKSVFERGNVLYGKLRPYFHKVGVAPVDGICSTDIVVMQARQPRDAAYVLAAVSTEEFVAFTDQGSTGTKMPRTGWAAMSRFLLTRPELPVADAFQRLVGPMVERIIANIHQSRALAATRDALLPRLMSGELRVRDAEALAA